MNVRGVKGKKRKRKTALEDKAQSDRFVKAAKELGVDESGQAFERAMDALVPRKTPKKPDA
jgi:hypothetical protein